MNPKLLFITGATTLCCLACGVSEPTTEPPGAAWTPSEASLLPWAPGLSWVYKVTDESGTSEKTTTVGDAEERVDLGPNADALAYKVVTEKGDGTDQTISWQAKLDDEVVRYREQSFESGAELSLDEYWSPYKLHADGSPAHTQRGAQWTEAYDETKISVTHGVNQDPVTEHHEDTWQVVSAESDGVSVTVPAGTFDHVLVLQKASTGGAKTYWYARGVGKVKETGSQTEELVSFSVEQ